MKIFNAFKKKDRYEQYSDLELRKKITDGHRALKEGIQAEFFQIDPFGGVGISVYTASIKRDIRLMEAALAKRVARPEPLRRASLKLVKY